MPDNPTCFVLWSHTQGEMPRIESVFAAEVAAEAQRDLLQAIWNGMKQFEVERHTII